MIYGRNFDTIEKYHHKYNFFHTYYNTKVRKINEENSGGVLNEEGEIG